MEATEAQGASRPRRANEVGPTGRAVASRVKDLREASRLTTEALAQRVSDAGQPMRSTTITKIEQAKRRVDVDDLMALAIALNVSPLALLLPVDEDDKFVAQLTTTRDATRGDAWRWGTGARALPPAPGDPVSPEQQDDFERMGLPPEELFGRRNTAGRIADELREDVYRLLPTAGFASASMKEHEELYGRRLATARSSIDRLTGEMDRIETMHAELLRYAQRRAAEATGEDRGEHREATER
ncbi:helix-turn-helix domain-containing protein [Streptomyces viridosporus]|uniref:helix-turn-helix domain-containing protein n=1 Tax=Streptomyces viridosporus TaxID=67581 RepID=UPI0037009145